MFLTWRKQQVSEEGNEDYKIRQVKRTHSTIYPTCPPPLPSLQTLRTEVQATATPLQLFHPHPLPPCFPPCFPPEVVCLSKCPWRGGFGWGGSPGFVGPAVWSWTTAGHLGCSPDPAEHKTHLDFSATREDCREEIRRGKQNGKWKEGTNKEKSIRNKQKGGIVEKGRKVQGKEHRRARTWMHVLVSVSSWTVRTFWWH